MENFGGHTYAAGMTMKPEKLEEFTRRFEEYVDSHIEPDMLVPQIDIDSYLALDDITPHFREVLCRFQPFGPGNPRSHIPHRLRVRLRSRTPCGRPALSTLKMDIVGGGSVTPPLAIAFSQAHHASHILGGGLFDICYSVVENNYRGEVKPQLRIKDIKQRK